MIQWWKNFWNEFLNNEAYFIARVRSAFGGAALLSVGFAKDFAEQTGWGWSERVLKIIGAIGLLVALLMRAGDKTPENVKTLVQDLKDEQMERRF